MAGFVYIMSNPLFSRIKIGYSSKDPTGERLAQLNSETGTAEDYKCEYYAYVEDEKGLELKVHKKFSHARVHKEFFEISILEAIGMIQECADDYGGIKFEEQFFKEIHKIKYQNGSEYEGETKWIREEKKFYQARHGYGVIKDSDGHINYKGNFKEDVREGEGFLATKFESEGKPFYSTYEGEFANNKKHGHGENKMYQGSYSDGKLITTDKGKFEDDRLVKGSRNNLRGGYEYDGDFREGKFHAQGSLKYRDGSRYEGQFKEGKKHGEGIFWPKDGGRWKVTYEEDKQTNSEQLDVMSAQTKVIIGCVIFVLFMIIFDDIF